MILFLFLNIWTAAAVPLETVYLNKLLAAKDAQALRDLRQGYAEIRQDRRICDIQTSDRAIPWACYRLLKRERRWRLQDDGQVRRRLEDLDRHCRNVAKSLLDADDEAFDLPMASLSDECRKTVEHVRETARYRRHKF
jgi:hypothetical protein